MPKIASSDTHASTTSGSRLASQALASIARGRPKKVVQLSIRAQRFLLPGIAAVLCVSLGWTIWLIVLTVFPNDTVNFVMGTREFDGGTFWAIIDPPTSVAVLGVTGLAIVLAGYLFVGLKVVLWGKRAIAPSQFVATAMSLSSLIQANLPRRSTQMVALPEAVPPGPPIQLITKENSKKTISNTLTAIATDLRHENTLIRKYATLAFAGRSGGLHVSGAGDFSRLARVIADPAKTAIIFKSLNSLRISSVLDFVARVGSNLVLCYRFHCVVALLHDPRRHQANLYPRRHPIAILFVAFALMTVVSVEESMRSTHIEGNPGMPGLLALPDGLFDSMRRLTYLHFGVHEVLPQLPSFQGLVNLRYLTLALLGSLREVPAFTHLSNLQLLIISNVPLLETLPDLAPISTSLLQFAYPTRGAICCNGFLDNKCDLDNPRCGFEGLWAYPRATCLPANRSDRIATAATVELLTKFWPSTCGGPAFPAAQVRGIDGLMTEALVKACNGSMYRQCEVPGTNVTGICYNVRFMPIECSTNLNLVEMRRRQIAAGVGELCDPEVEGWLGCKG
ncbi:hypothetical protein BBJ28_00003722 [Nothophytophthora sp. Chile5]|nr:hypothetical protein BBJ28_00003722 [Nothophytophthora sp. Chile5]